MKLLYMFFCLIFIPANQYLVAGCHDHEREALQSFKSYLSDPTGRLSTWNGINCCNWSGISCSESLHVKSLDLRNPNPSIFMVNMVSELVPISESLPTSLNGTLSPSLFTLTHLTYLDLSHNNFMFSKIPVGFANLTRLTYLNFSNAMFSGTIPTEFANLTSLEYLDLSCSLQITDISSLSFHLSSDFRMSAGPYHTYIPKGHLSSRDLNWLMAMSDLKDLRLTGMDLSQASNSNHWAKAVSLLSNLEILQLSNCRIHSKLPIDKLLNLTRLHTLYIDFNSLPYQLPYQLQNLTSLVKLDLTNSHIQGSFPYLPQLKELDAGSNPDLVVNLTQMFVNSWPQLEYINIHSTQVNGSLPASFANTSSLVHFIAYNCFIVGPFPAFITKLSKLETLRLDMNNITGQIPVTISDLQNLRSLSLMQNLLEGNIPNSICNMIFLEEISLAMNSLSGDFPDCIGQLPNLLVIRLANSKMNGTLSSFQSFFQTSSPDTIMLTFVGLTVKFSNSPVPFNFQPRILQLVSCNLEGQIPEFIRNMTNLEHLELSYNNLSGELPVWLFNLPKLGYLDLSCNNFEGTLPQSILLHSHHAPTVLKLSFNRLEGSVPHFDNVHAIDLSFNNFSGQLPPQIGLGKVRYLSLSGNQLKGPMPTPLCQAGSMLTLLDLSNNSLSGVIPESFGNCTSLTFLNLGRNNFSGSIPHELEHAKSLSYLDLSNNHFHGSIPSWVQKLQDLLIIKLGNNRFEGRIPPFIGGLRNLRIIVLPSNSFSGSIPWEISELENLQYIDFSRNNLSGPIPKEITSLKKMRTQAQDEDMIGYIISATMVVGVQLDIVSKGLSLQLEVVRSYHKGIDLSINRLTGSIPGEIGHLQGLHTLNLSHNDLLGEIPDSFGNMSSLESLDLSYNYLTGQFPTTFALLDSLTTMNFSYNNLSGRVPLAAHLDTLNLDGSAFIGNKYFCGAPDGMFCNNSASTSPDNDDDDDETNQGRLFFGFILAGYAVGLWCFFAILYFMKIEWRERYWKWIDNMVAGIMQCSKKRNNDVRNF